MSIEQSKGVAHRLIEELCHQSTAGLVAEVPTRLEARGSRLAAMCAGARGYCQMPPAG